MSPKWLVLMLFGGILAIGTPIFIAKNLQLGSYAKSPQTAELSLGASVIVGGGRAKLWYAGGSSGAMFELTHEGESALFDEGVNAPGQAFGLTVTPTKVDMGNGSRPPRATFEVKWDEGAKP